MQSLDCFHLKELLASDSLTSAAIIAGPVKRATGAGHNSSSSSVSLNGPWSISTFGGVPVSDAEKATLTEISSALKSAA